MDEELAGLAELLDTMREDIPVDDLVLKDADFHRRIIAAAGNPVLGSVLETMSRPLRLAPGFGGRSSNMALSSAPAWSTWPFSTRFVDAMLKMRGPGAGAHLGN